MNADQLLRMNIGDLVVQNAVLAAKVNELEAKLKKATDDRDELMVQAGYPVDVETGAILNEDASER